MKTTNGRIALGIGVNILPILVLPQGSEKYRFQLRHIAMWIAKMMKLCDAKEKCDENGRLIDFYNVLNMDTGTGMNADTVLYHVVYYIKQHLGLSDDTVIFKNQNGIIFDFRRYYLHV